MPTAEQIQKYIQQLPEEAQAEVLHYVERVWRRTQQNGSSEAHGRALAEILERLAAQPTRVLEEDPVAWQRSVRQSSRV